MTKKILGTLFILCLLTGCSRGGGEAAAGGAQAEEDAAAGAEFDAFVDRYFTKYFDFYPSNATAVGLHEYDSRMEEFTSHSISVRMEELDNLRSSLASLRKRKLSRDRDIDARVLAAQIDAELLEFRNIRSWRKNPLYYLTLPGNSVDSLMKREFSSPKNRLRDIVTRMQKIEPLLHAMHNNVAEPPKEFTDLGVRIARGSISFFRDELGAWAKTAAGDDHTLYADFVAANRKVISGFEFVADYLERDLKYLPGGSYSIGADNYRKKLAYEEMVDVPLDRLLQIGEANLEKDYKEFVETAKRIDPGKSPADVMKAISDKHPSEQELVGFAKATLEGARQFVVSKRIISIPSEVRPAILHTPPYARSGTFASMDTPGPFERKATEAFYYVTPPEANWKPAHKEEHLRLFNKPVMDIITVHEAFPGHYVQFLYAKQFPTKTRKLIACGSNAEGWAHYAEQMMVEEGFGDGDPKIKLAQLSEALLRDCRYVAGIKLHTQGWTVEQATRLFIEKGFQEPANAFEEARRGAYNPTYLYYTLGKLQIYKLREDYKRKKGSAYTLEKFHSDFVKQGAIPINLVREILLDGDKSPSI